MKTMHVRLEKIDWDNYAKVLKLRVKKEQENYIATNTASLIHAFLESSAGKPVHSFAVKYGKSYVGFMQILYDNDWTGYERKDWLSSAEYKKYEGKPYYYIWRFMIDKKHQGRGFGKEAFEKTLDFIKTRPDGEANYVMISYDPHNEIGKKLYASFGFAEVFKKYLHDDDEVMAMLKI